MYIPGTFKYTYTCIFSFRCATVNNCVSNVIKSNSWQYPSTVTTIYTCTEVDLSYMNSRLVWRNRWVWDCQLRSVTYIHVKRVNKLACPERGWNFADTHAHAHIHMPRLEQDNRLFNQVTTIRFIQNVFMAIFWDCWIENESSSPNLRHNGRHRNYNGTNGFNQISTQLEVRSLPVTALFLMMSYQLLNPSVNTTQVLLLSSQLV